MESVIHSLENYAGLQPDALVYAFLDGAGEVADSYTYRRFHTRSNYMADVLRRTGAIRYGEPALLVYPPGLEFIVAFFACVKLGALPVPAPPLDASASAGACERLAAIAQDCGATVALTTREHIEHIRRATGCSAGPARRVSQGLLGSLDWRATDEIQGECTGLDVQLGPLLFLQYTSGSTQAPRGVMVSHANVVDNGRATLDNRPITVTWLPHYHDMGLIGYYLFPLLMGGSARAFSNAHFLRRPRLWLEAISRYRATAASAPNVAFDYCLREDKIPRDTLGDLDLRSLLCLMNASEPVRASTYERFLARFEPCGLSRKAFVVYYGLAENTLSVTGGGRVRVHVNTQLLEQRQVRLEPPKREGGISDQTRLVSCGRPLPGIDVRVVDIATGAALGEDLIGEVWVAGASKAQGYWKKPALTQAVFEAAAEDGQLFLKTGDLAFIHEGELFVCGRLKDVIIVGGRNFYANDIEAVVEGVSEKVRQGCVAAFAIDGAEQEGVVVLIEARGANDLPDLESVARELRRRCQLEVDVLAVVPHGTIVRTSSGKIARQECRSQWRQGRVRPLARRDRTSPGTGTKDSAVEFFERLVAGAPDTATLADLGADSLALVEMSLHLKTIAGTRGLKGMEFSDLRVLQSVTVREIRGFLTPAPVIAPLSARLAYRRRVRAIESEETALMRSDARLPGQIQANGRQDAAGASILLTGATGFLGSFLLEALLRQTDRPIVAVVRAEDAAHAQRRVESALQRTGLWRDDLRRATALRVQALPGDIAQPMLGLDRTDWDRLSGELASIYHCGAEVDYVKPYAALRDSNVSSMLETLRLATTGSRKIVNYVSTTFVFGFTARHICYESDVNAEMAGLNFGYTQTKWVAEQLVHEAARRGVETRVYRPAFVTASRQGRYIRRDLLARIFTYMIRRQVAPDSANQLSCLPVDVCANNIAALSLLDAPGGATFHLTADRYYSMQSFCESIARQFGYEFEYMNLERLVDHLNRHCRRDDPIYPLMAFFNHNFRRIDAMRDKRYSSDCYRFARSLSATAMAEPELDQVASAVVRFLQQERLVPSTPARAAVASGLAREAGKSN